VGRTPKIGETSNGINIGKMAPQRSSFDKEDPTTSVNETPGKNTSGCAGSNNDVVVAGHGVK
jgi:hypothetical protein